MQTLLTQSTRLYRRLYQRMYRTVIPLVAAARSPRGRRVLRLAGYGLMTLALLFILFTLVASWQQVRPYLRAINLRLLLWAQLCTLIAYGLGGLLWLAVLRAFAIDVRWQWGVMTHFVANAAKYVPGYGWQYISKGVLLREQGKGPRAIGLILMTEVLLLLSSGVAAALLAGAVAGQIWAYAWRVAPWVWWLGLIATMVGTAAWNHFVLRFGVQHADPQHNAPRHWRQHLFAQRLLWGGWGLGFIGWLWFAVATLLLVNALAPITNPLTLAVDFSHSLFALVASGIVSILVIIVPGGFGVREATLAALLDGLLPFTVATIVSILMRLIVIVSECIGLICLPYLLKYRITPVKRA